MTDHVTFSSSIDVQLIKQSMSDVDVVAAARVSTAGERSADALAMDPSESAGLIQFLLRERHGSVFEHSHATWLVRAPIFVWREHMRHRIASYNEESARYRKLDPVFYLPGEDRNLVQTGKTGYYQFLPGSDEQKLQVRESYENACRTAYAEYEAMIAAGVAKEVARGVLPVTIFSSAYVTMNARALMNFLSLRRKVEGSHFPSYPQREIEMVAEEYEKHFAEHMPITHAAFEQYGRVAP